MESLSPKGRVCIFSKTPAYGKVKTRLEKSIGKDSCLSLHKWLVEDRLKISTLGMNCVFQLYVTDDIDDDYWLSMKKAFGNASFPSIHMQMGEGLGERLDQVAQSTQEYAWTILIGADCPELDRSYLELAITALNAKVDAVIGPAVDGGYVLLGFKDYMPELFQNIDWGTGSVLAQTKAALNSAKRTYQALDELRDLDLLNDLVYYSNQVPEIENLLSERYIKNS